MSADQCNNNTFISLAIFLLQSYRNCAEDDQVHTDFYTKSMFINLFKVNIIKPEQNIDRRK